MSVEITTEAAENYIHAVAVALDAAGYTLPSAVLYWFGEDVPTGGITLLEALPGKTDLGLSWELEEGWKAGYPHPEGGIELVEDLLLDVAPPPWRVVAAVKAIARTGRLEDGVAESADYPAELLPLYEPAAEGLVQAAADAMKARGAARRGLPAEPASADGLITSIVTPIVAAVYAKVRGRLAVNGTPSVERLAEILWTGRKKALDLADIPLRHLDMHVQEQYVRYAAAVAEQLGQERDTEGERLRAELEEAQAETCKLADERDEARAEVETLRGLLGDARVQYESARARADTLLGQRDALRAELAEPVKDEDAATVLRILKAGDGTRSGATYLERALRQAERERDGLAEQAKRRASFEVGEMGFGPDPKWRHASEIRCTACGAMIAQAQNFEPTLAELDALADRHQCLPRFDGTGAPE